jgi:LysM repeat protein
MSDRKTSRVSRWLAVLLLISLLAALLPMSVLAGTAEGVKCARYYDVNKNSTLTKIASAFGYTAGELAWANDLRKPYTIYVGQKLCIPEKITKSVPKAYQSVNGSVKAANFVAGLTSDNKILLHPYTYPNTTVFIKVRSDGANPGKWYKIGTLTIGSSGNGKTYTYKVPTDLQGNRSIQICLKDRTTSYLQCVKPLGQ